MPAFSRSHAWRTSIIDVDDALRVEGIRLVSLDNPDRWTPDGQNVKPQKLLALHSADATPALRAIRAALGKATSPIGTDETAERAIVVWLPRKENGWQHPDPVRTVYPPRIERLALDCSGSSGGRRRWPAGPTTGTPPAPP